MSSRILCLAKRLVVLVGCLLASNTGVADESKDRFPPLAQARTADAERESSRSETEAAKEKRSSKVAAEKKTLDFVRKHQPKLLELLSYLKGKQPSRYQQALREMARSQQRLDSLAKRDEELYRIELELWQVRSRQRLLAAEMSIAPEARQAKLTKELTALIQQEVSQELARFRLMRSRAAKQLAQFDEQIRRRTDGRDEMISKSLKSWQNRIKKETPRSKKASSNNQDK